MLQIGVPQLELQAVVSGQSGQTFLLPKATQGAATTIIVSEIHQNHSPRNPSQTFHKPNLYRQKYVGIGPQAGLQFDVL